MAEEEEDVGVAAPRLSLQEVPETMPVVGRDLRGRGDAACSERASSSIVGIGSFVNRKRESNGSTEICGVAKVEESVRVAARRRG